MKCIFKVEGFIVRFRKVNGGILILVGEKPINNLAKPQFHWLAVWGPKARAIEPKLKSGRVFSFEGAIAETWKNGKAYQNYTVETWRVVPRPERPVYQPTERDDDWFVPEIRNRDTHSDRLAEGFTDHLR